MFKEKPSHVANRTLLSCICDDCGDEFQKEWRSLFKGLPETICNGCMQTRRFKNPNERKRQSNILKAYYKIDGNLKKNSDRIKKYHRDHPEFRKKLSEIAHKKFENQLERDKVSIGTRKRFENTDERLKISESQKIRYKDPSVVKKSSDAMKLVWATNKDYRRLQRESLVRYYSDPVNRQKSSKIHKIVWENSEFRSKMIPIMIENAKKAAAKKGINKKEAFLFEMVKPFGFHFNGCGETVISISGFIPDFINETDKLIIELNGCYWHKCKLCYPEKFKNESFLKRDVAKLHAYPRNGYRVLFIWEHDLEKLEIVMKRIRDFIENKNLKTKIVDS